MASISLQEDDLANAVAYAEKGRVLLKALQDERGTKLPQ
jgi:superkiller protein 3